MNKYSKRITYPFDTLYSSYGGSWTVEQYKQHLADHLKQLDEYVAGFKKEYPEVSNIEVHVDMDEFDERTNMYARLFGELPLSPAERAIMDARERELAKGQEQNEKKLLANLMKKHPNYKP
jgi:hypothetical protein